MKIFKKLFGSKNNEISKYEPNTLAEINESPDLRKSAEEEQPLKNAKTKGKENKKSTKPTAKSSHSEIKPTTTKAAAANKSEKQKKEKAEATTAPKKSKNADPGKTETPKSVKSETNKNDPKSKATTPVKSTAKKAISDTKSGSKVNEANAVSSTDSKVKSTHKKPTATKEVTANSATKKAAPEKKSASKAMEKPSAKKPLSNKTAEKTNPKGEANKSSAKVEAEEITEVKATRTGKFEIKKSKDGRYVFNLYASNNVIVATSQVYSSSTSAMNGIKSVIANAASAPIEDQTLKSFETVPFPKWEVYKDKGEQYRFRLCASNGSCVCHSQGYTSKTSCKKGIESIIKFAADAEITKAYINKDK